MAPARVGGRVAPAVARTRSPHGSSPSGQRGRSPPVLVQRRVHKHMVHISSELFLRSTLVRSPSPVYRSWISRRWIRTTKTCHRSYGVADVSYASANATGIGFDAVTPVVFGAGGGVLHRGFEPTATSPAAVALSAGSGSGGSTTRRICPSVNQAQRLAAISTQAAPAPTDGPAEKMQSPRFGPIYGQPGPVHRPSVRLAWTACRLRQITCTSEPVRSGRTLIDPASQCAAARRTGHHRPHTVPGENLKCGVESVHSVRAPARTRSGLSVPNRRITLRHSRSRGMGVDR